MEGLCWAHLVPLPPRHIKNQISRELPRYLYSMQMATSLVECLHVYQQAWYAQQALVSVKLSFQLFSTLNPMLTSKILQTD